jgi:hypothetical protein
VLHDGEQPGPPGPDFGFVPQEDIIHRALALHRTLVYAAVADGVRAESATPDDVHQPEVVSRSQKATRVGVLRQWALLTRRSTALLLHSRLSVAVLAKSLVMIVACSRCCSARARSIRRRRIQGRQR